MAFGWCGDVATNRIAIWYTWHLGELEVWAASFGIGSSTAYSQNMIKGIIRLSLGSSDVAQYKLLGFGLGQGQSTLRIQGYDPWFCIHELLTCT